MKYDVFISYRREGGSEMARILYDRLKEHGISPFLDVEEMRSGPFNTQLYDRIDECSKIVLVLPKNALDRCKNPDDWVRLEIEHALKRGKTIIPVMQRGFSFPKDLPAGLETLPTYNGIEASMDYFDAMVERLIRLIGDVSEKSSEKRPVIDMRSVRAFSEHGMEATVFKITKEEKSLSATVNFEPTRVRKEIPGFAGLYFSFNVPYKGYAENKLRFDAYAPNGKLCGVSVEVKPEGKKWMHESFAFKLSEHTQAFEISFGEFLNPKTYTCIEEITFVFTPVSFANENDLSGSFVLENIEIV